ncbi:MAG TPA: P-loop NTPase fold protein [bacterium]|nr:P-loop NTPase fold protein [bacterium]
MKSSIKEIKAILSDLEGYYEEVSKAEGSFFYSNKVWDGYNNLVIELNSVSGKDYSKFMVFPIGQDASQVDLMDFKLKINNLVKRLKIEISDNDFDFIKDNDKEEFLDDSDSVKAEKIEKTFKGEKEILKELIKKIQRNHPKQGSNLQLLKEYVKNAVSQFSPREQKILEMRFGLVDGVSHTLDEVGQEFEISREDVRNIESIALGKIRKMHPDFEAIKILNEGSIVRKVDNVKPVLSVRELADQISNLLIDMEKQDGSMFGVFGRWGRGKTFLMNRIKENQAILDKFNIVDFNAWKYQETPALWSHLYRSLLDVYYPQKKIEKFLFFFKKNCFLIIFLLVFLSLLYFFYGNIKTFVINNLPSIKTIISIFTIIILSLSPIFWKIISLILENKKSFLVFYKRILNKDLVDYLGDQCKLQNRISLFIKKWSKSSNKKVLLFVDNLDRCSHNKILEVIDSLRIILDDENIKKEILVIVAIDERILTGAIKNKYEDMKDKNLDMDILVKEYMDKLFLSGVNLPDLNNQEKLDILGELFEIKEMKNGMFNNADSFHNLNNKQNNFKNNDNDNKHNVLKKPDITQKESVEIGEIITKNEQITPRQIDIFRFRYLLIRYLLSVNNIDWQKFNIALLMFDYSDKKVIDSGDEVVDKIVKMVVCY